MRYEFGGLVFGGAYTWRGLFSEFYGTSRKMKAAITFVADFLHSLSQYRFYHWVTTTNNNGKKQINYMKHVYFICYCCEVILTDDNHCFFQTSSVKCVRFTLNEIRNSLIYKFRVYKAITIQNSTFFFSK